MFNRTPLHPAGRNVASGGKWGILMQAVANGLVLCAALALLLAWGSQTRELDLIGAPQSTQAERDARFVADVEASIAAQVAALGCDTTPRLTDEVAVRNAARSKAGAVQFDTVVVRLMPFEQAWDAGRRGEVHTVGWCGK